MPAIVQAQVSNDNIENRIRLELNEPVSSNTIGATVQWNCLNQSLTRSCIKYHNDQWFEFSVSSESPYYINLSGQDCRDIWGVQVLVFAGTPCAPETYELLKCYSEGNRDDVYITLNGLKPGVNYLLNVDGYLNDQCSFELEISDKPRGLPVQEEARGEVASDTDLRVVEVSWEIPDIDGISSYEVWKNTGDRSVMLHEVPHEMNSFGAGRRSYSVFDTLYSDAARYTVVANASVENRIFIGETMASIDKTALAESQENIISFNIEAEKGDEITVELWDADDDKLLYSRNIVFDPRRNGNIKMRVMQYREDGVSFFKVVTRNRSTGKWDLQFFEK